MDFTRSPVLVEFCFGLALLVMVPVSRAFHVRPHAGLLALSLAMAGAAWCLAAPFALMLFLFLAVALGLSHPVFAESISKLWVCIHPVPKKPWFLPVLAGLGGLFLTMAPARIIDMIEEARVRELESVFDGQPDLKPLQEAAGSTDQGNPVGLYVSGADHEANDLRWLRDNDFDFHLMRLEGADNDSNCHGHVFTGGRYWILGRDVPAILRDNGYTETANPVPGDIVVYRDADEVVTHTGIVRAASAGFPTLVESKWGHFGVYIHPVDRTPYTGPMAYHHTDRPGGSHIISITAGEVGGSGQK